MTAAPFLLVEAAAAEMPTIAAALAEARLPTADLGWLGRRFYSLRDRDDALAGFSGLEVYGEDALLRSVVVLPAQRHRGAGRAIVSLTLEKAAALGARRIFLLTTEAQSFFAHLGFTVVSRGEAPPPIAATDEFGSVCPATATCMTTVIRRHA